MNDVIQTQNNLVNPQLVQTYLTTNSKFFPEIRINEIKNRLSNLTQEQFEKTQIIPLKDPVLMLIVSLFAGSLGIDRFMLGETGLGVVKLLTAGGCGIWTIIDWFTISKKTKDLNYLKVMNAV